MQFGGIVSNTIDISNIGSFVRTLYAHETNDLKMIIGATNENEDRLRFGNTFDVCVSKSYSDIAVDSTQHLKWLKCDFEVDDRVATNDPKFHIIKKLIDMLQTKPQNLGKTIRKFNLIVLDWSTNQFFTRKENLDVVINYLLNGTFYLDNTAYFAGDQYSSFYEIRQDGPQTENTYIKDDKFGTYYLLGDRLRNLPENGTVVYKGVKNRDENNLQYLINQFGENNIITFHNNDDNSYPNNSIGDTQRVKSYFCITTRHH
jgi:hypothetical protein